MPARCPPPSSPTSSSSWAEERRGFDEPGDRAELLARIVELRRQCGDARGAGVTLTLLARIYWAMGRIREGFACAAEAVEILEPLGEGPELAHAYAGYSLQEMTAHHGSEAVRWGRRAVELAERVGAPEAQLMALNAIGLAQLECFEQLEGIEALERAARLAEADGDDYEVGRALGNLGAALGEIRRYEQAAAYLERAIAFSEERDLDDTTGHATAELAKVRFEQGSWDEADRLAASALRHREVSLGIPIVALCVRGRIARPPRRSRGGVVPGRGLGARARYRRPARGSGRSPPGAQSWPGSQVAPKTSRRSWSPRTSRRAQLGLRWAIGELGSWLVRAGALERLPEDVAAPYAASLARGGGGVAADRLSRTSRPRRSRRETRRRCASRSRS